MAEETCFAVDDGDAVVALIKLLSPRRERYQRGQFIDEQFVLVWVFGDEPLSVAFLDESAVGELAPVGDGDDAVGVAADDEHCVVAHESSGSSVFGPDG